MRHTEGERRRFERDGDAPRQQPRGDAEVNDPRPWRGPRLAPSPVPAGSILAAAVADDGVLGHAALDLGPRRRFKGLARRDIARCERAARRLVAVLAGTAVVAAAAAGDTRVEAATLTALALACGQLAFADQFRWSKLVPYMGAMPFNAAPLLAFAILAAASLGTGAPHVGVGVLLIACLVQAPASMLCRAVVARCVGDSRPVRLAVIGGPLSADVLRRELHLAGMTKYLLVGRIAGDGSAERDADGDVGCLGRLADVDTLVREHDIDLLLMTGECGRMQVFEAIWSCLRQPVRLVELTMFYEDTFGHVPAAEINAAWFQYIVHPSYAGPSAAAKRALDIVGAVLVGIPFLVALAVLAPLIRRDGGPVFFWQTRVGEGGRPLRLCKLRTMRVGSAPTWASADDPRVTPIGRLLRRTHVDELPQLLHILRGEMSLVGPRPEQPHIVEQLEREVPFYSSRHLIRPGIAGWAQLRCGYAGSELGSAWKLCHDLYYLKHRSLAFDLTILGETVRTLFVDSHRIQDPTATFFIVGRNGTAHKVQPVTVAGQHVSVG